MITWLPGFRSGNKRNMLIATGIYLIVIMGVLFAVQFVLSDVLSSDVTGENTTENSLLLERQGNVNFEESGREIGLED